MKSQNSNYQEGYSSKYLTTTLSLTGKVIQGERGHFFVANDDGRLEFRSDFFDLPKDDKSKPMPKTFPVTAHRILLSFILQFSDGNGLKINPDRVQPLWEITVEDYADFIGKDIHQKDGEGDNEYQTRRSTILDMVHRQAKADLNFLLKSFLYVYHSKRNTEAMCVIDNIKLVDGRIQVRFGQAFAEHLVKMPLGLYPIALFGLDMKKQTAYKIGFKCAENYSILQNHLTRRYNRLKVKSFLKGLDLPTIKAVRSEGYVKEDGTVAKGRGSWSQKIRQPFEKGLDELVKAGILAKWHYKDSKTDFTSYEEWSDTVLIYDLKEAPDLTEAVEKHKIKVLKAKQVKDDDNSGKTEKTPIPV